MKFAFGIVPRGHTLVPDDWPGCSLRTDILLVLGACYESADGGFPMVSPHHVLRYMNDVGPGVPDRYLSLIEAMLESLWRDGLIGRMASTSVDVPHGYMSRAAAEAAIRWGAPVILMPRRDDEPKSPSDERKCHP